MLWIRLFRFSVSPSVYLSVSPSVEQGGNVWGVVMVGGGGGGGGGGE